MQDFPIIYYKKKLLSIRSLVWSHFLCGICTILILIGHGLWREIISLTVRIYSYHPLNQVRQNRPCTFSKKNCYKRIIGCYVGTNKAEQLYERINPPKIG